MTTAPTLWPQEFYGWNDFAMGFLGGAYGTLV